MKISGHKTGSMYSPYNIVSERDLVDVKEKMERFLSDTPETKADILEAAGRFQVSYLE